MPRESMLRTEVADVCSNVNLKTFSLISHRSAATRVVASQNRYHLRPLLIRHVHNTKMQALNERHAERQMNFVACRPGLNPVSIGHE